MIGKLSGIIDSFHPNALILDVSGVGYLVQASSRTLTRIGQIGDAASLLIETNVREDAITLYGFTDEAEQAWFKLLTSVQGVGAKVGLKILSVCPPEQILVAIAAQDKEPIRRADGVGPKLATRILTELKDKAGKMAVAAPAQNIGTKTPTSGGATADVDASPPPAINADAVSALINLGYARSDAYTAVMQACANDTEANLQAVIRQALKALSS